MASDSSPPRSNPSLFNSSLFSTPTTSAAGDSNDFSSLGGLGDTSFNSFNSESPFTLAPAAPAEALNISSPPKYTNVGQPLDTNQVTELSTVPLDSPLGNQATNDDSLPSRMSQSSTLGSVHGWNDPPLLSAFSSQKATQPPNDSYTLQDTTRHDISSVSEPSLHSTVDTYNVQPLMPR